MYPYVIVTANKFVGTMYFDVCELNLQEARKWVDQYIDDVVCQIRNLNEFTVIRNVLTDDIKTCQPMENHDEFHFKSYHKEYLCICVKPQKTLLPNVGKSEGIISDDDVTPLCEELAFEPVVGTFQITTPFPTLESLAGDPLELIENSLIFYKLYNVRQVSYST